MVDINIPENLAQKLDNTAEERAGFDSPEELAIYILTSVLSELEEESATETDTDIDEDDVEDRLKDLGYMG
ncbi:hypothetical protein [Haloarcula laminariae]|uniref:hypothetical protein n=1 Tax=Haloarcula laminariae TaxID=2961577 RepID=UPI0024051FF7|nr:hypothetical protein [Halomicroarcula sp. FL173]